MKISVTLFLLLLICATGRSQDRVFKTYQDYISNTGEELGKFIWAAETYNKVKLIFEKPGGGKIRCSARKIWGFSYQGHLFRSTGTQFGMLVDTGKVCSYVNGVGALAKQFSVNWSSYLVSVDGMGGKLYGMPADNGLKKDFPALKKDHPELEKLFNCIKKHYQDWVSPCVRSYNTSY